MQSDIGEVGVGAWGWYQGSGGVVYGRWCPKRVRGTGQAVKVVLRKNQRHHSLRTRLWYTPPAAVKKPTEETARERGLGVGVGRDSRYGSIYVCPPSPSRGPAPRCSSLSSSPPLSPPDPTPSTRPTGRWRGTQGPPGASSAGLRIGRPARRYAGGGLVAGRRQLSG